MVSFSRFCLRFSLSVSFGFFFCSLPPLSLLPLSPITISSFLTRATAQIRQRLAVHTNYTPILQRAKLATNVDDVALFNALKFVKEQLPALAGLPNPALNLWRRDLAIPSARVRNLYFYGSLARLSGNQLGQ